MKVVLLLLVVGRLLILRWLILLLARHLSGGKLGLLVITRLTFIYRRLAKPWRRLLLLVGSVVLGRVLRIVGLVPWLPWLRVLLLVSCALGWLLLVLLVLLCMRLLGGLPVLRRGSTLVSWLPMLSRSVLLLVLKLILVVLLLLLSVVVTLPWRSLVGRRALGVLVVLLVVSERGLTRCSRVVGLLVHLIIYRGCQAELLKRLLKLPIQALTRVAVKHDHMALGANMMGCEQRLALAEVPEDETFVDEGLECDGQLGHHWLIERLLTLEDLV